MTFSFVSKEPVLIVIMSGELVVEFAICFERRNKILAATNVKIIAKLKWLVTKWLINAA